MLGQVHSVMVLDEGNEVSGRPECRAEDVFRRATFAWAMAAKKMAASSAALGSTTKVSSAALADIAYVRDVVASMHMPAAKPGSTDDRPPVTAVELRDSISNLVNRIEPEPWRVSQHVSEAPPVVDDQPAKKSSPRPKNHRGRDLSAPVYSKAGRMLWAKVDCPVCPSKATERCQKPDGTFSEKPHEPRKTIVEEAQVEQTEETDSRSIE